MPLCHRRRSNSAGINYCYYPFLILLLLPAIIDGTLPSSHRRHAVVGTNIRRKHLRTIWQRRRGSFILRVSRGGGPAVVLSVASDANEANGMENNVTIRRTSTTDITATPPPLHNDTTYGDVREESEEEDGIVAAAVATNGDVSDDIDIAVTPTTKITIAATEIQYVTKKDGTMELFNKEKVR